MGPGVHDQPEHADRHGQPGDRRPRLRAGPGRGLPGAVQHRAAARGLRRRAPCASTCSATPTCWPSCASSTPPSTTGTRRSRSRSSPRCGPATTPRCEAAGVAGGARRRSTGSGPRRTSSPTASTQMRTEVAEDRERAFTYVWFAIAFGTAILLVTGLLLGRGLRRQVLDPMSGLVAQTRQVAAGNLDLEIAQDGPLEIQNLAVGRRPDARDAGHPDRAHRARPAPDPAAQRRAGPLQRRPRAVRLRRVARPLRAAAQGHQLLPAPRASVRRPARRQGPPVHRLHGRRRQADAGADQRPARLLAGRPDPTSTSSRSTSSGRWPGP